MDGGAVWGPLQRDSTALDEALGEATRAVYAASTAAQWRTEAGYPIYSPLSDLLGGLSTVIDALIDQREESRGSGTSGGT